MCQNKLLQQKILSRTVNGKISCKAALDLAEELGINPRRIGEMADKLNVKIAACQLGCFGKRGKG